MNFSLCANMSGFAQAAGPAESVWMLWFWPDQFFLKVKAKFHFLQKASNKQSASVIMGLIRLIILSYNR